MSNQKINPATLSPAGTDRKFSWGFGKRGNEEREGGAAAGTRAAAVPDSIFTVRLGALV